MKQLHQLSVISIILYGLLISCKPPQPAQEEVNKAVMHRFTEILNSGDFDLLEEVMKPNFVRHCQASSDVQISSLEEYKHFNQQWVTAFPDLHTTNHVLVAEGDMVAAYATTTGTQTGPMGPFPASGKKMESDFIGICRLEDGEIAEMWVEWDNVTILTQLGHFPPLEKSEE